MQSTNTPLGYLTDAAGPVAQYAIWLEWLFGGVAVAVCIIVTGWLIWGLTKRRPAMANREIIHTSRGLRSVLVATGISTTVLFVMTIIMLIVLNRTAAPPREPGLTIEVTGYQWWWKVVYAPSDPARRFETANEIHIPVGVPVRIQLETADVIHAFWVPALAGKTQMIPGQSNQQWLEADRPGIYRGQCTQFCGAQHAHMIFEIIAEPKAEYAKWEAAQRRPIDTALLSTPGAKIFMQECAACHALHGTDAIGAHGPDLTHLASRRLLAAGTLPNNNAERKAWVKDPEALKPGTRMPGFALEPHDASSLSDFLSRLQ